MLFHSETPHIFTRCMTRHFCTRVDNLIDACLLCGQRDGSLSGMGGQASYMSGFWSMVDCYFHPCHLSSVLFKLPQVKTLDDCGFMITQGRPNAV